MTKPTKPPPSDRLKKIKWGSTKYLKVGALYYLEDARIGSYFRHTNEDGWGSSANFPAISYLLYLGEEIHTIRGWKFYHLELRQNIISYNNSFAQHIKEVIDD